MKYQRSITREVFNDWPIAKIRPHNEPIAGEPDWLGWEHYRDETRDDLLKQIEQIEQNNANKG
jgi:hypothetical protein